MACYPQMCERVLETLANLENECVYTRHKLCEIALTLLERGGNFQAINVLKQHAHDHRMKEHATDSVRQKMTQHMRSDTSTGKFEQIPQFSALTDNIRQTVAPIDGRSQTGQIQGIF